MAGYMPTYGPNFQIGSIETDLTWGEVLRSLILQGTAIGTAYANKELGIEAPNTMGTSATTAAALKTVDTGMILVAVIIVALLLLGKR